MAVVKDAETPAGRGVSMKSYRHLVPRAITGLVLSTVTLSAFATSFVVPSDRELVEKADAIIRGVVASSSVIESETGFIETLYDIAVTRRLKGDVEEGTFITVRSPGGNIEDRFL